MQERFERIADQFGMEQALDVQHLMYDDPDRADVAEWLAHMRRDGGDLPGRDAAARDASSSWESDDDAFSTFVTAEKTS